MPYQKETFGANDVNSVLNQAIEQKEGKKVNGSIKWVDVRFYEVVVFGRLVSSDSTAMEISIAYGKRSLAKEKKIPAELIFTIKSCHPFVQRLLIHHQPPKRSEPEYAPLWYVLA
jgi:hypothetical protein